MKSRSPQGSKKTAKSQESRIPRIWKTGKSQEAKSRRISPNICYIPSSQRRRERERKERLQSQKHGETQ
jgi:hypothetical protein